MVFTNLAKKTQKVFSAIHYFKKTESTFMFYSGIFFQKLKGKSSRTKMKKIKYV